MTLRKTKGGGTVKFTFSTKERVKLTFLKDNFIEYAPPLHLFNTRGFAITLGNGLLLNTTTGIRIPFNRSPVKKVELDIP
jgi:hypothetical protein